MPSVYRVDDGRAILDTTEEIFQMPKVADAVIKAQLPVWHIVYSWLVYPLRLSHTVICRPSAPGNWDDALSVSGA